MIDIIDNEKLIAILKEVNNLSDLSKENVVEKIQEKLKENYHPNQCQEWEEWGQLNINYMFASYNATCNSMSYHSLLHIASKNGLNLVRFLLDRGAEVNIADRQGETPLHLATQKGHEKTAKILINAGANTNAQGMDKATPLIRAVGFNKKGMVELLLEKGADIELQFEIFPFTSSTDLVQGTPFQLAIERGQADMIPIMVNHIIKLVADGKYVSTKNLQLKDEVQKLQQEKIGGSNVSLWKFLFETDNVKLADYLNNPDIKKELETGQYKEKFPLHADMIESRYKKGIKFHEMDEVKLGKSNVSLLRFLFEADGVQLAGYLSNPDVRKELETGQYKGQYRQYAYRIESQYKKAKEKVKERFLHTGGAFINYLSKHYKCNFDNMKLTEIEDFLKEHKNDRLDIMEDRELLPLENFINVSHLYSALPLKTLAFNQAIQNQLNDLSVKQAKKSQERSCTIS